MLAVIGTVPDEAFGLCLCTPALDGMELSLDGVRVPVNRGTPALLAAALKAALVLGTPPPKAWLAGDTGLGRGSRELYALLVRDLAGDNAETLAFHYLQPDVDWHNKVLFAVQQRTPRPRLIADAGFMYAAKMSGMAPEYDLFTPDVGELAFLADDSAPHPFYTRGFILQREDMAEEYIRRAMQYDNAARHLLVKGCQDLVADASGIIARIDAPSCPAMEAMGGTGDTLTGIVAALVDSGMAIPMACTVAARANRLAGEAIAPTPASQIREMIGHIPDALRQAMAEAHV